MKIFVVAPSFRHFEDAIIRKHSSMANPPYLTFYHGIAYVDEEQYIYLSDPLWDLRRVHNSQVLTLNMQLWPLRWYDEGIEYLIKRARMP